MISIENKENCCGCEACASICPKKCISIIRDKEGFLYPKVDKSLCINCGLCENVCPCINRNKSESIDPNYRFFATRNSSESDLEKSSSGSIFPLIAKEILKKNGVVFGARWNEKWEVIHDYCEDEYGLKKFQGSKYVQSHIGNSFINAKSFLNEGRLVLFSGVPCQILALKRFLKKDYENLLCVDVFCYSILSPMIWQIYLEHLLGKTSMSDISDIKFRKKMLINKNLRTDVFSIEQKESTLLYKKNFYSNTPLGKAFINNLCNRPSCNKCPAQCLGSQSDISLGDFWGANKYYPDLNVNIGLSLSVAKTPKGLSALENIFEYCAILKEVKEEECTPNNEGLKRTYRNINKNRAVFFEKINKAKPKSKYKIIEKYTNSSKIKRIKNKIKSIIKKFLNTLKLLLKIKK